jgi:DNA-binding CsgD family transcriptional regulator
MASRALTRRQAEIAALLAQDLTNETIARRLAISPSTVSTHIQQLRWRLGLTSRNQIAASVIADLAGADDTPGRLGDLIADATGGRLAEHTSIRAPKAAGKLLPPSSRSSRRSLRQVP